jgi:mono/diheme cytochrome c family protein
MGRIIRVAIVLFALGVVALILVRGAGISARRDSWPMEERVATAAWRFLIPRESRDAINPVPNDTDVLRRALEHWADHCAVCHAADGSGQSTVGQRTYPRAPDMRLPATQTLTDGELFYAIEQGIPWTAMPGWRTGTPDGERASWELVHFIRHLPKLTPAELTEMEKFLPKSPVERKRDQEIDDFLRGPVKKGG